MPIGLGGFVIVGAGNPREWNAAMSEGTEEAVPGYRYTAQLAGGIEQRWQEYWDAHGTYHAPNPVGPLAGDVPADKLFVQDMFPYPSGAGLHVGHPLGVIGTDVFARYHRMTDRNVLHTMGFAAFGLPAEQYAVQTGQHPRKTTEDNIQRYLSQIRRLGLGHDERRRIATTDLTYYRWTQWIFLQIYNAWFDESIGKERPIGELVSEFAAGKRSTPDGRAWADLPGADSARVVDSYRLVYQSEAPVNWCPGLGTVVANEEVPADGRSDRGNFPVFRKNLRQWMMRITAYADRLIDDLDLLDWSDQVKSMQRNWIGRSQGAHIRSPVAGKAIEVFTTRPDTVFGATYMVLAPEPPLVDEITADAWPEGTDERWTTGAASPADAIAGYRRAAAPPGPAGPAATHDPWTTGPASPADAIAGYRRAASQKSELDRQENKDKTGVFTGAYATNPVNDAKIPA